MKAPPLATDIWVGRCGAVSCNNVHIDLINGDTIIACAAIPLRHIPSLIAQLQACAYGITVEQDE